MKPLLMPLLAMFARDLISDVAKQAVKQQVTMDMSDSVRVQFLNLVANSYTEEIAHNISQYVKSIEAVSVEISSGNGGEKLFGKLQKTLGDLSSELEQQGPDSPVIQYLQERYGNKSSSVVGRAATPIYTLVSGYSKVSDPSTPWLNRVVANDDKIGDILASEASRVFDKLFASEISGPL